MRYSRSLLLGAIAFLGLQAANGQHLKLQGNEDESMFYAQTKQVNQFFRRFNNEEDLKGERYNNKPYRRNDKTRVKYLERLFDNETSTIDDQLKQEFIDQVTNKSHPEYLEFKGGDWYAEVSANFLYKGREEPVVLYMQIQKENLGSKWDILNVYFQPYREMFNTDTTRKENFLHPLSHEIDFMNLHKVFDDPSTVEDYTYKGYSPDYLTLFLFEVKKGFFTFETVINETFHFYQIDGWYFKLSYFNRKGYNTGWLISDLHKTTGNEKEQFINLISNE